MKQIFPVLLVVGLMAAAAQPARAQMVPLSERIAVGPQVGTGGIGGQVAVSLVPRLLNLDIGFGSFTDTGTFNVDGTPFHYKVRVGGVPVVAVLYPFHNWFNLQAGLVFNNNRASVVASAPANVSITVFGHTYTSSQIGNVSGATRFSHVAPFVGLGFGQPFAGGRVTFTGTAGVLFEGQSNVVLGVSNPQALLVPGVEAQKEKEQATINHDLSILATFPIVNLGVVVRF